MKMNPGQLKHGKKSKKYKERGITQWSAFIRPVCEEHNDLQTELIYGEQQSILENK